MHNCAYELSLADFCCLSVVPVEIREGQQDEEASLLKFSKWRLIHM